jgi:GTPase SAR1 family protein
MEEREPKLGVAIGRKGCGKTYTTNNLITQYVTGNPLKGVPARKVLVLDVNDEYGSLNGVKIKALRISDIMKFSIHPTVEARRIRPFFDNGTRMTTRDLQDTLFEILNKYRGGMLLIEDINRYVSDNLPNDLIGAICTNRHTDTDIIMHFQSVGRISPKIWQNINWLRFHKITDSVTRHKDKFEDKFEMLQLVENYINDEYDKGNKRIHCYVDIDDEKIKVNKQKMIPIIEQYLNKNYKTLITPLLIQNDLGKGVKKISPAQAVKVQTDRIFRDYFD